MKRTATHKRAVALDYDSETGRAPTLAAKALSERADDIVKIARRFGIPVIDKGSLAEALYSLDVDQAIPESLYEAVAVILNELDAA